MFSEAQNVPWVTPGKVLGCIPSSSSCLTHELLGMQAPCFSWASGSLEVSPLQFPPYFLPPLTRGSFSLITQTSVTPTPMENACRHVGASYHGHLCLLQESDFTFAKMRANLSFEHESNFRKPGELLRLLSQSSGSLQLVHVHPTLTTSGFL